MTAPAEILSGSALADAIASLDARAHAAAYLEYEHQFEHLADAVDPLQAGAERSGLVATIGHDAVQAIIVAPFARFRDMVAAEIEAEEQALLAAEPDDLTEYDLREIARRVERWEAADQRRSYAPASSPRPHGTPQSTIDAFWHVVRAEDPQYLARWLAQHPADAPHLHEIWGRKCSTAAA
jgi:hypothetical protein